MHQPEGLVHVGSVEVVATADDLARPDLGDGAAASTESLAVGLTGAGAQRTRPTPLRVPLDDDMSPQLIALMTSTRPSGKAAFQFWRPVVEVSNDSLVLIHGAIVKRSYGLRFSV
jgi:hypothetical protein